jgi:hypothetical protein
MIRQWHRSLAFSADVAGSAGDARGTTYPLQLPVLLIRGKEDWRADFKQAKKMKAALEANHKEFEWLALSREGHGVYDEETRRECTNASSSSWIVICNRLRTGDAHQRW